MCQRSICVKYITRLIRAQGSSGYGGNFDVGVKKLE